MKNFLSLNDVSDLQDLIKESIDFKANPLSKNNLGQGKTLGLIFMNPSLRTRLSTQQAAFNLGMNVMVVNLNQDSWQLEFGDGTIMDGATVEHVKDAAAVLSQYCDIIGIRTFAKLLDRAEDYNETILSKFLEHTGVPVVSLESATLHPLQSLADLITIEEEKRQEKPKIVLSWAPHPKALPQAVANSFLQWVTPLDYHLAIVHPPGYELSEEFIGNTKVYYHQEEAFSGADFVYAKNWSSYQQYGQILSQDQSWTITKEKMAGTNKGQFMHCLPLRRNMVATDEVVDHSLVIKQAKNRIFSAQAVLSRLLTSI